MKEKMIEYLAKQIGLKNAVILTNGILSLPIEGCDCTLGELPDRYREMREALVEALGYAEKFIKKCEDGRARSVETQRDMRTLQERINDILKEG